MSIRPQAAGGRCAPAMRAKGGRGSVQLAQRNEQETSFRVLSDVARLLVSESDLARVLDSVAQAVASLIPYDSLIVYEADNDLQVLRPVQVVDPDAKEIYVHICPFGQASPARPPWPVRPSWSTTSPSTRGPSR